MSKRLRNSKTGVVVSVRDDKQLGSEWVPVAEEVKPQPIKSGKSDKK